MSESAPGFSKHPGYQVSIKPCRDHIRILAGNTCIAESDRPLRVEETKHHPVWYLPLADVNATYLQATEHSTYCPFKGHASYWTVATEEQTLENSIWGYPAPYAECESLKDCVAFYTDRLTLEVNGTKQADNGPGWIS